MLLGFIFAMFQALGRGLGGIGGVACSRLAFTPVSHKKLDEDRLLNPVHRDPNSGIDRVLKIFDREWVVVFIPSLSITDIKFWK